MIKPSLDYIFETALSCFGISEEEYNKEKDTRSLIAITVRQAVCLLGQCFGHSQSSIGKFLEIDHSTVCYNKKIAQDLCDTEADYARNMMLAIDKLESNMNKLSEYNIHGWVARDEDNELNFYMRHEPIRASGYWISSDFKCLIPEDAYPNITFECEPQKCVMTLKLK